MKNKTSKKDLLIHYFSRITSINIFQVCSLILKLFSILSGLIVVPILVRTHGVDGFALFSLASASIYVLSTFDFGISNLINSTSRHDHHKINERLSFATLFFFLALLLLAIVMISRSVVNFGVVNLFKEFNLNLILILVVVQIFGNFGMKVLLISDKLNIYLMVSPLQPLVANLMVVFLSPKVSLEKVLILYFILSNFLGLIFGLTVIFINLKDMSCQLAWKSFKRDLSSLLTFQHLQLMAIFNTQGMILIISNFFSLDIVAAFSFFSRVFLAINQLLAQYLSDYWNEVARLVHANRWSIIRVRYKSQLRKVFVVGLMLNSLVLLFVAPLVDLVFPEFRQLYLFVVLSIYWTGAALFMPMSYTLNGLLYSKAQILWQSCFSLVPLPIIIICGVFGISLSLAVLTYSLVILTLILPLSHRNIQRFIATQNRDGRLLI